MSLSIASLNSGSNGNCYYVGNEQEAVLIDAGISCREIEKRMKKAELSIEKVKAVFISHEHTDHIRGVEVTAKKYNLPVYITEATRTNSWLKFKRILVSPFESHKPVTVGTLNITGFSKQHDAADPYSFVVECKGIKIGVMTDIGVACEQVVHYFRQCHAAFLESNYDEQMLQEGRYTARLKKRISSGKGHLSNMQALELFLKHRPSFMSHLFLSHLSKNNNRPEIVMELFNRHAGTLNIEIASRDYPSPVYHIYHDERKPVTPFQPLQLMLFE